MTDAAGVAAGGAGAQDGLALDEHDAGHAAFGEMPGNACPHAPASDDDDVRGGSHAAPIIAAAALAPRLHLVGGVVFRLAPEGREYGEAPAHARRTPDAAPTPAGVGLPTPCRMGDAIR
jgi:hypothetical protein